MRLTITGTLDDGQKFYPVAFEFSEQPQAQQAPRMAQSLTPIGRVTARLWVDRQSEQSIRLASACSRYELSLSVSMAVLTPPGATFEAHSLFADTAE